MGTVVPMKPPEPAVCGDCSLHGQPGSTAGSAAGQDGTAESGGKGLWHCALRGGLVFWGGAGGCQWWEWEDLEVRRQKEEGFGSLALVSSALPGLDVFGSRAETLVYSDQIENVISLMFANSNSWNVNVNLYGLGENES